MIAHAVATPSGVKTFTSVTQYHAEGTGGVGAVSGVSVVVMPSKYHNGYRGSGLIYP
jgi:hypothetical protein